MFIYIKIPHESNSQSLSQFTIYIIFNCTIWNIIMLFQTVLPVPSAFTVWCSSIINEVIRTISIFFKKRKINNFPPFRSFWSFHLLYHWCVPPLTTLWIIYLYALIFLCDHLWESFLFYENIFKSFFLCSSVRIYFLTPYENKQVY